MRNTRLISFILCLLNDSRKKRGETTVSTNTIFSKRIADFFKVNMFQDFFNVKNQDYNAVHCTKCCSEKKVLFLIIKIFTFIFYSLVYKTFHCCSFTASLNFLRNAIWRTINFIVVVTHR